VIGAGQMPAESKSESPQPMTKLTVSRVTTIGSVLFLLIPLLITAYVYASKNIVSVEDILNGLHASMGATQWWIFVIGVVFLCTGIFTLHRIRRSNPLFQFVAFMLQGILLGALLFSFVPTFLDILARSPSAIVSYDADIFGPTVFLYMFTIFVNIHHYFIDNVIWKRANPLMKYVHVIR
jgi:hypothetical protein